MIVGALAAWAASQALPDLADDGTRKASVSCWWVPDNLPALVSYAIGGDPRVTTKAEEVAGSSRSAPWTRKRPVKVGEVVYLSISWPGVKPAHGQLRECTVKAGKTVKPDLSRDLVPAHWAVTVT